MGNIRVGVVGIGSIFDRHAEAIKQSKHLELYAICHHRPERLCEVAERYNIKCVFNNYDKMLMDLSVQAVVIATPNYLHKEMIIKAIRHKKHVFCEKPPALNLKELEDVEKVYRETDKVMMFGFMHRFSPKYQFVKGLIDSGAFGSINMIKAGIIRRNGNPGGWFANKKQSGGGPVIDLGSHLVNLISFLLNESKPTSVFAKLLFDSNNIKNAKQSASYTALSNKANGCNVEDGGLIIISFENGAFAMVEVSYSSHIKKDKMFLEIQGEKAGMNVDPKFEYYSIKDGYLFDETFKVDYTDDHQEAINKEFDHFESCIVGDEICTSSIINAKTTMSVINAIYKAYEENGLVAIDIER